MDSITQIALGASVAAAVGIKPFGRNVLIVGAVLGTLPDLDVLISYQTAVENFTYHRGFSHSLFVLIPLSILLYQLTLWIKPTLSAHKKSLFFLILLPLITHPLLDSLTSYGTQLWWPMTMQPTAWSSIFIIDPLYTVPLLIAAGTLWTQQYSAKWQKVNRVVLLISTLYLGLGLLQVGYLKHQISDDPLVENNQIFISPTPFNTVMWRVISYQQDAYYETYTSIFTQKPLAWQKIESGRELLNDFDSAELQRLEWFSGGLLQFSQQDQQLIATDIRIGLSHYYPFSFSLANKPSDWQEVPSEKIPPPEVSWEKITELLSD